MRVSADQWTLTFDVARGVIGEWTHGGRPVLAPGVPLAGPRLTIWRAVIDNEARGGGDRVEREWREHGLHLVQHRIEGFDWSQEGQDGAVKVTVRACVAPPVYEAAYDCVYEYTILPAGDVLLSVSGTPRGEWPSTLPRIGLEMALPPTVERAEWLGLGPGENYPDSKQAALFGLWRLPLDDLFTPYVRPQENGNRSDCRWAALTDTDGAGLVAAGNGGTVDFSASRYTTADLDRAQHTSELEPRTDRVVLHLDWRQNGVGSGSCGPGVLPQHQLAAVPFTFGVRLSPLAPGETPGEVGRRRAG